MQGYCLWLINACQTRSNYQGISQIYLIYGIIGTLFEFLLFLEVFSINDVASMSDEPLEMFDN